MKKKAITIAALTLGVIVAMSFWAPLFLPRHISEEQAISLALAYLKDRGYETDKGEMVEMLVREFGEEIRGKENEINYLLHWGPPSAVLRPPESWEFRRIRYMGKEEPPDLVWVVRATVVTPLGEGLGAVWRASVFLDAYTGEVLFSVVKMK